MIREKEIRDIQREKHYSRLRKKDILGLRRMANFVKVNCPACNSKKYYSIFKKENFNFMECRNCSTIFVNPRPDEEGLKWYYTQAQAPREFSRMVKAKENKRRELIYRPRAKLVISLINEYLVYPKRVSLAEIGAGTGGFLELLRKIKPNWQYSAIEPEKLSAYYLREKKFKVIERTIEEVKKDEISGVDVILNFELIEHIFNPYKFIKKIYLILKTGGLFILTTPNCQGFDFLGIGKEYKNIAGPNHLNYFNPHSIKKLLEKSGFQVLDIKTPGMMDVDLVKNFYHQSKDTGNKFLDLLLYKTDNDTLVKFQHFLQEANLSGHMLVLAKKS